jgi:hypothetical protein
MGYYAAQRAAIKTLLESVSGIGNVYASQKDVTNEANFKTTFVKNGVVNVCWFIRSNGSDDEVGSLKYGRRDERNYHTHTQIDDNWTITIMYGYKDDNTNPSEYAFQALVDSIQDKFRLIQDLGGEQHEISHPLQRSICGIFSFLSGIVLCHKAEWRLGVTERAIDTGVEY